MKVIKGLSLKLAGLLSLVGATTACGDMAGAKATTAPAPLQTISKKLEQMGRFTREHSSTPASVGGSCGGGGRPT